MNERLKKLREDLATKNARILELSNKADRTAEETQEMLAADGEAQALMGQIETEAAAVKAAERAQATKAFLTQNTTVVPPAEPINQPGLPVEVVAAYGEVTSFKGTREEKAQKAHDFGRFLYAALKRDPGSVEYCKAHNIALKAMSGDSNVDGAAMVPIQFVGDLISLIGVYGVARQVMRPTPMSSDSAIVPRRTGGVTTYYGGQGATITASDVSTNAVELHSKNLFALVVSALQLSDDSFINIGNLVADELAVGFAKAEDEAMFLGTGATTYGGIFGIIPSFQKSVEDAGGTWTTDAHKVYNPGIVLAAGNAFSEVTLANLHSVKAAVKRFRRPADNRWFCNQSFYDGVMQRLLAAAGGAQISEIVQLNSDYQNEKLLGKPVVFTEVMIETEANSGVPLVYGDPSLAGRFGDRQELTIARSVEYGFATGQEAWRGMERYDIVFHDLGTASSSAASRARGPLAELALQNA